MEATCSSCNASSALCNKAQKKALQPFRRGRSSRFYTKAQGTTSRYSGLLPNTIERTPLGPFCTCGHQRAAIVVIRHCRDGEPFVGKSSGHRSTWRQNKIVDVRACTDSRAVLSHFTFRLFTCVTFRAGCVRVKISGVRAHAAIGRCRSVPKPSNLST